MLVLTRQTGESLFIGDAAAAVTIKVLTNDGRNVRIGIDASVELPIFREEIFPDNISIKSDRGGNC